MRILAASIILLVGLYYLYSGGERESGESRNSGELVEKRLKSQKNSRWERFSNRVPASVKRAEAAKANNLEKSKSQVPDRTMARSRKASENKSAFEVSSRYERVQKDDYSHNPQRDSYMAQGSNERNFSNSALPELPVEQDLNAMVDSEATDDEVGGTGILGPGVVPMVGSGLDTEEDEKPTSTNTDDFENHSDTAPQQDISCGADRAQGTYSNPFILNISCSEASTIVYCLQTGGGFCDPYNSPNSYTPSGIDINLGDNSYGVSFYAIGSASGVQTDIYDLAFVIDSTIPALLVEHPLLMAQTTQLPLSNTTRSVDFGKLSHFYHQINFKSHDPTAGGLNWSCEDMLHGHSSLVPAPVVIETNYGVDSLLNTQEIFQTVDMPKLAAGDNYIATIIQDQAHNNYSCQVQNVKVLDFPFAAFSATGVTPVGPAGRKTAGSFSGFGHFHEAPGASSGALKNDQAGQTNHVGSFGIAF